jgi:hypothetical protein
MFVAVHIDELVLGQATQQGPVPRNHCGRMMLLIRNCTSPSYLLNATDGGTSTADTVYVAVQGGAAVRNKHARLLGINTACARARAVIV